MTLFLPAAVGALLNLLAVLAPRWGLGAVGREGKGVVSSPENKHLAVAFFFL